MTKQLSAFFFFLAVMLSQVKAQTLEDFNGELRRASADTARIKAMLAIADYHFNKPGQEKSDLDSASRILAGSLLLSKKIGSADYVNRSLKMLCYAAVQGGNINKGKTYFNQIATFYQKHSQPNKLAAAWYDYAEGFVNQDRFTTIIDQANLGEMMSAYNKALVLSRKSGNMEIRELSLSRIGDFHLQNGELDSAENELLEILSIQKAAGKKKLYDTYQGLDYINAKKGNLEKALYYSLESIKNAENIHNQSDLDMLYGNLAKLYIGLHKPSKAIEAFQKSFDLARINKRPIDVGFATDYAAILTKQGRTKEALGFINTFPRSDPNYSEWQRMKISEMRGNTFFALGRKADAEKSFSEMYDLGVKMIPQKPSAFLRASLMNGQFNVNIKNFEKARPFLLSVLKGTPGLISNTFNLDANRLLYLVDSAAGNFKGALGYFKAYKRLDDSIYSIDKTRQFEELQVKYDTEKNKQDILLLTRKGEVQQAKLQKAAVVRNAFVLGAILLAMLLALAVNRYRIKKKGNEQLQHQQVEINLKNQYLNKLVDDKDGLLKEKEWLIKEIHHRVKNNLQIVISLLNTQSVYLDNDKALSAIRESQHRMHSISLIHQKLYQSENMALIEMRAYIKDLIEYLEHSFDTSKRIRFCVEVSEVSLDVTHAVPLGLILNEAITNAVKYAFSNARQGNIWISIKEDAAHFLSLEVSDDGKGFAADFDINNCESLGMNLMKGLSRQIGGSFLINSTMGRTTLTTTFLNKNISDNITHNEMQSFSAA